MVYLPTFTIKITEIIIVTYTIHGSYIWVRLFSSWDDV